jgi:large subunit ribosomal protein L21
LEEKEGSKISFDKVLLLDDGKVTIGAPVIENAVVTATVLGHLKGDKVIVFKKKRRKGFKKRNGHRQYLSQIQIESISTEAPVKKAAVKKEEAPAEIKPAVKKAAPAKKEAVKKEVVKKEAKAPVKAAPKAAAKKASPKK